MRQFDFTTNIEKRVPGTGKVYMIDRMTSDWAERHPLNVDQFIEDVYQEFAGTAFEESREALHKVWSTMLSVKNPQGDASVYPNNNGARRPAAIKVWLLAGDYWRRGFRMGDVLPERCPSHTITRLSDGGWIALFPKDMHLLDGRTETREIKEPAEMTLDFDDTPTEDEAPTEEESNLPKIDDVPQPTERNRNTEQRRRRREQREAQRMDYEARLEREAREAEEYASKQERRKIFAAVGAAAVTLVMIYFFGLLGPAVFGLLCGGLLKG